MTSNDAFFATMLLCIVIFGSSLIASCWISTEIDALRKEVIRLENCHP